MIKLLFEYMAILIQENRITNTGYSFFKFDRLLRENYDLGSYDELGWWFSNSNAPKFFFRIIFWLRMPTRRPSEVSNRFSKFRKDEAKLTPDFKDNSPQWWKKRSQKTKCRMAYKVTMHSMPNMPKGLIWGIKWNAIKFWANYVAYRTFHLKNRFPSDPPKIWVFAMKYLL